MAFDTHETVKDLTSAGFNEAQAEAVTRAVRAAAHVDLSDVATKHDLAHELALLEARIDAKMAQLRSLRRDLVESITRSEAALADSAERTSP